VLDTAAVAESESDPDRLRDRPLSTDGVMADVQARVRTALRARLLASGATALASDERLFDDVDALFRAALANEDPGALLLPQLLPDDLQPELALRLSSHRGGLTARLLVGIKRRLLLPLNRWLFEFTLDNFRRQHRLNLALMACLQTIAVEHARLAREVAELRAAAGAAGAVGAAADARESEPRRR
jgi:hypothetical protein